MAAKMTYAELMNRFSKIKGIPKDKQLIDIDRFKKLQKDEERIEVINWDTMFDVGLKSLLYLHFSKRDKDVKKLFDPSIGGPLVSLTHKARLAYALGLIDKTSLNDFEHIHKIRNEFAHSVEADFADGKVLKQVKKLSISKGHKVMANNASVFLSDALERCIEGFKEAIKQETYRKAALKAGRKSVQE